MGPCAGAKIGVGVRLTQAPLCGTVREFARDEAWLQQNGFPHKGNVLQYFRTSVFCDTRFLEWVAAPACQLPLAPRLAPDAHVTIALVAGQ